jgi:peptide/nickel transport system permease protein
MIAEARPFIVEAPWVAIAPGIVLCITVIAVNLIGDACARCWTRASAGGA